MQKCFRIHLVFSNMFVFNAIFYGIIVGIIFYCIYWLVKFIEFRNIVNKFPGRKYDPIIGDVLHMSSKRDVLFQQMRDYTKEFPNGFRIWAFYFAAYNFTKAKDFELILSSPKHIEKKSVYVFLENWLQEGLLTSAGSKWHQRRKILTPAFHFNVLRRFATIFGEHSEKFVEELRDECTQDKTNIIPLITKLTLDLICETAMGVKLEKNNKKQEEYRKAIHEMGDMLIVRTVRPWYFFDWLYKLFPTGRRYFRNIKILHEFTYNVIKERERNFLDSDVEDLEKEEDLTFSTKKRFAMLDLLISAKRNRNEIDDVGIREEVDTFMFEGHDTTSVAITFTLFCLANYKDIQEKARQEIDNIFQGSTKPANYNDLQKMSYLEMVIKESLRLYPSVPFIARTLNESVPFRDGKYTMPKFSFVHFQIYDLHRDPEVFPDPKKFDPDRFLPENTKSRNPYAYVPFSAGPRNCIGQKFAMLELKSVISSILRNYELEPIDTPETIEILMDLVLRPKSVYLRIRPRKPYTYTN